MEKYPYLRQLNCFEWLQEKVPYMLDIFEREMKWYEEEATDDDIGECGENLSHFLIAVYGGNNSLEEYIKERVN